MRMKLDTLFKKSNATGKIEQWDIEVIYSAEVKDAGKIVTTYGERGGKMQTTSDIVTKGKNIGKKNATTAFDQACAEATSKWEKKLKTGYVKSLELAESGAKDEIIEGGIEPMLAHPFEKQGEKISYPCLGQPKLDGIRCIAIKKGDNVTLWTRTRKPIYSCPHIVEAVSLLPMGDIILDGELYNHDLKNDFEKIVSAVRKDEPSEESKKVQYHVYDIVIPDMDFIDRAKFFKQNDIACAVIHVVPTVKVESAEEVPGLYTKFASKGYEGAMLRNIKGHYEHRRSVNLIKVKKFEDKEFKIVGAEEGRGKLSGHLGAWVCENDKGMTFKATMSVPQEIKKTMWTNKDTYLEKQLTVQFQGVTKDGIPRFPIGKAVRDYE
jgi:DNA ligase-1